MKIMSDQDRQRASNIKGLLSNPSTKPIIIITGAVLVGIIGLAAFKMGQTADDNVPSSASVGRGPSDIDYQPGVNASPAHTVLQQQANAQKIEAARAQGQTSLPTLVSNQDVNQPITLPTGPTQPPTAAPTQAPTIQFQPVQAPVEQQPVLQAPPLQVAPAAPVKVEVSEDVKKKVDAYLTFWGPKDVLFQEYTVINGEEKTWEAPKESPVVAAAGQSVGGTRSQTTNEIRFVRAGTTVAAKLITPLNSDAPGPVLAEISYGPLAGARLIGSMSTAKNSLLVTFNTISKPGWPSTYSISAVGMDVDKSTALATDVNNHYIQKYGGLLAGSFIQGYGQGLQQQGSVTYLDPVSGGVVSQTDQLSGSQIAKTAQGEVLRTVGRDVQRQSQLVTPTIKVEGQNGSEYPLQILFLKNF